MLCIVRKPFKYAGKLFYRGDNVEFKKLDVKLSMLFRNGFFLPIKENGKLPTPTEINRVKADTEGRPQVKIKPKMESKKEKGKK